MASLSESQVLTIYKQIEVMRGRPTPPIMASIKFRRSLLLLVALIKCSMTSATDINIDVCRNNMEKFGDAG